MACLTEAGLMISDNQKRALDIGAGTGNITGKLLQMGYEVTAVDISAAMCAILEKKYRESIRHMKLVIINSEIEGIDLGAEGYDFITSYSVLHHLPDYMTVIHTLATALKKGGVMYLDCEPSPYYWRPTPFTKLLRFLKPVGRTLNCCSPKTDDTVPNVNARNLRWLKTAEYWNRKEQPLDHNHINEVLHAQNFTLCIRRDYHRYRNRLLTPFFRFYRVLMRPELSLWIAKK
jgi:ubiquinone/menaquinone biosynthesis C-methylase UbiE